MRLVKRCCTSCSSPLFHSASVINNVWKLFITNTNTLFSVFQPLLQSTAALFDDGIAEELKDTCFPLGVFGGSWSAVWDNDTLLHFSASQQLNFLLKLCVQTNCLLLLCFLSISEVLYVKPFSSEVSRHSSV